MSKSTTIRAIAKRAGVRARAVLATLPGVGVTGKLKHSKKIDKSLSSKIESQLVLPYDETDDDSTPEPFLNELDASFYDMSDVVEPNDTEVVEPAITMEEEIATGTVEVRLMPGAASDPLFGIDRYVEVLEKASSNALEDLVERNNRLRCLENFEILHKVLAEIGIPSGTVIYDRDYNEWGELRFSVYQRILLNALGHELVRKLELQPLLYTAKQYRDAIAHLDIFHLSAEVTKWIADRMQMLTVELMVCHKVCAAEVDDLWSENPADSFYEFFKIHQTLHCLGDEAIQ